MKIGIVGVYQTKFGELWNQSLQDLIKEAIFGCLKDGQVQPKDIQSAYIGNMLASDGTGQKHLGSVVSQILGLSIPTVRVEAACASGGLALHQAVQSIKSGENETALVIGAEKMTDIDSYDISQALMAASEVEEFDIGLTFPGLYALMAKSYIQKYQLKEKELAGVAVKNHHHAQFNPKAQFRFPVTIDQVLNSPKVADPLKMLDCSPVSDGAAAVFIASSSWVKKNMARNGVYLSGSSIGSDSISLSQRDSFTQLKATQQAAAKAYSQSGIEVKDINCVEVHDCFSIAEIIALEDLGLYPKGEGFHHLTKEETWLGGKRPVNTSGGLKACGHPVGATGIKQIVEATQQLRRESTNRQVEGAQVAVTHNVGGSGGTAVVHVITR